MRRITIQTVVFCLATVLVILPVMSNYALAEDTAVTSDVTSDENGPSLATASVDMLAVRPLGIASTVVGLAAYVVSLPFSIPGGNSKKVWKNCVEKPASYTFKRPIGEF